MATVDASSAGTAHGTLTANTPEVIDVGRSDTIEVQNRGTTIMYGKVGASDLTLAAQGTEAISAGETVTFYAPSSATATICLKSSGTPDYSVSRFGLRRESGGGSSGGGGGGAVTQSGTWTVQPGNTANTTAWKVDGSAVTQPVSAASLPLPSGAATVAKQPALGTAGTASADVLSVQGVASMTALKVDGSAVTQPVSGTVTADTELPAAAALSDTTANPTTPMVGSALMYWDGTQWLRWQRFVKTLTVSSATLANVSGSASSVAILASNANARSRLVHNDSTATLYLKYGTTASATSFTVAIGPGQHYEFPTPIYTGACDGIWSSATGAARTTETT